MKKNGYTGIEILIVIIVLGVATLAVLTTTSNAFKDNSEELYSETKHLIEHQASLYGKSLSNLKDEGNVVITLDDMINAGYYVADSNGNVVDPRNSNATLNNLKIKLIYNEDETILAKVIDDE